MAKAERVAGRGPRFGWRAFGAAVPGIGLSLLPKIACPACWPAYAGVLSSFGVTFLIDADYLLALTAGFLAVALFFLGFRAKRRRGARPLALGVIAAVLLLVGKFQLESDPVMFAGVGLLMLASLWNSWPRRAAPPLPRRACTAAGVSANQVERSCCDPNRGEAR